jgi:hypothetical protein
LFDTLLQKEEEHIFHNLVLRNLLGRDYYCLPASRVSTDAQAKSQLTSDNESRSQTLSSNNSSQKDDSADQQPSQKDGSADQEQHNSVNNAAADEQAAEKTCSDKLYTDEPASVSHGDHGDKVKGNGDGSQTNTEPSESSPQSPTASTGSVSDILG